MKTDIEMLSDVREELKWDPQVYEGEVGLAVKDSVVTLSGSVQTYAQKFAAERAAARVSGVRVVADDLEVVMPKPFERSDTEIAHQVARVFEWHTEIPRDKIKARVENGWVWLEGTADWQYQRVAAEQALRFLTGIKGVNNLVAIKAHPTTSDVSKQIGEALRRSAETDAKQIHVEMSEGRVTLKGTVRSYAEKVDAERAAWAATGVIAVDDDRLLIDA